MRHEGGQPQWSKIGSEWGPVLIFSFLVLCLTGVVLGHARDGAGSFFDPQDGVFKTLVALPVRSLGIGTTYCLGSLLLGLTVWICMRQPVEEPSRRAIGLALIVLSLSAFMAVIGTIVEPGGGRVWGGAFGTNLAAFLSGLGRGLGLVASTLLLGFAVVVGRDWFFYNALRNWLVGGEPKPALATGLARAMGVAQRAEDGTNDPDFIRPTKQKESSMIGTSRSAGATGVMTPMLDAATEKRPGSVKPLKSPAARTGNGLELSMDDMPQDIFTVGIAAAVIPAAPVEAPAKDRKAKIDPRDEDRNAAVAATAESVVVDLETLDLDDFDQDLLFPEARSDQADTADLPLSRFFTETANQEVTASDRFDLDLEDSIDVGPAAVTDVLVRDMGRGREEKEPEGDDAAGDSEFEEDVEVEEEDVEIDDDEEFDDEEEIEDVEEDGDADFDADDDDDDYDADDVDEDLFASLSESLADDDVSPEVPAQLPVVTATSPIRAPRALVDEPSIEDVFAAMSAEEFETDVTEPRAEAAVAAIDEPMAEEFETLDTTTASAVVMPADSTDDFPALADLPQTEDATTVASGASQPAAGAEEMPELPEVANRPSESPVVRQGDDWATWMDEGRPTGIAKPSDRRRRFAKPVTSAQAGVSGYFEQPSLFETTEAIDPAAYVKAVKTVLARDQCSVSLLQRELGITFAMAAAAIDRMERDGIIGPYQGSANRQILVTQADWENRES